MKEIYTTPSFETELFTTDDIITTSGSNPNDNDANWPGDWGNGRN